MVEGLYKTICCPPEPPLPDNIECFGCDIMREWQRLLERNRWMTTRRQRLIDLSRPRVQYKRFVPKCACVFRNTIQIERLYLPMHTRTEQLSYPLFRKLLLFKREHFWKLTYEQQQALVRRLRLSLLSLYSRLQNIQPPVPPIPKHVWDKDEWKLHRRHFRKLAKPKKLVKPPKVPKEFMDIKSMKRFKKLAKPKMHTVAEKEQWELTPGMKFYSPTDRIQELAKPKTVDETQLYMPVPWPVSMGAKKYKASERILELAMPAEKRTISSDLKENPFSISPNALKAKPSRRIEELAEPKEYENTTERENPFSVSPKALKAKATPRLIELARPKGSV